MPCYTTRPFLSKAALKRTLAAPGEDTLDARRVRAFERCGYLPEGWRTDPQFAPRAPHPVYLTDPSMFGPPAWESLPEGETCTVPIVGPGPYDRRWYGTATVDRSGRVLRVK